MIPAINATVALIVGFLGQYVVFRKFKIKPRIPKYQTIIADLKSGWNIFISIVAINTYTTTRVFAVGLMTNNTVTGFYSVGEKIANCVQTFPLYSFTQAIFPRLSKIFHKSKKKAYTMMKQIQEITIRISIICLPVIFLFAPYIVLIICGGEYPAVVLTLRLLLISVFFISANAFRVQFLLISGHTKIYSQIHITMAIISLPLIIFLIDTFSYLGAAVTTIIVEAGIFMLTYLTIQKLKFK